MWWGRRLLELGLCRDTASGIDGELNSLKPTKEGTCWEALVRELNSHKRRNRRSVNFAAQRETFKK